jgi:hypothetical protein
MTSPEEPPSRGRTRTVAARICSLRGGGGGARCALVGAFASGACEALLFSRDSPGVAPRRWLLIRRRPGAGGPRWLVLGCAAGPGDARCGSHAGQAA